MKVATITSGVALKDYLDIKGKHADILTGIANQKITVDAFNQQRDQQKAAEVQNKQVMQNEMQKEKMVQDTAMQKNTMDYNTKQAEIEIKRVALSQP